MVCNLGFWVVGGWRNLVWMGIWLRNLRMCGGWCCGVSFRLLVFWRFGEFFWFMVFDCLMFVL